MDLEQHEAVLEGEDEVASGEDESVESEESEESGLNLLAGGLSICLNCFGSSKPINLPEKYRKINLVC